MGALNPEEPFSGVTVPVHIKYSQNRIDTIVKSSRRLYTKKWKEIKATSLIGVSKPNVISTDINGIVP
ncbi:hypothetical protein A2W32_01245 [candidate division WWE3 bacterium RBG_16_37_10]|uniref:Uncharacterized protein n=1 Tax=candidate division WWE3 bacterium RBG_16_37_10 TaxID=1802610 RepID=A0A1F4UX24_UNCKA|nr:MAG: hypothetical protein A2W32_01245 [candidate division WWE3 bacterium RBG_16_37_10]